VDIIKKVGYGILGLFIIALIVVLKTKNPAEENYFPKCPFLSVTGYKCPGCGSQRAMHNLLNFKFFAAAKENLLLVLFIPYLIIGVIFDNLRQYNASLLKWHKILFGRNAVTIILIVIGLFWLLRNLI